MKRSTFTTGWLVTGTLVGAVFAFIGCNTPDHPAGNGGAASTSSSSSSSGHGVGRTGSTLPPCDEAGMSNWAVSTPGYTPFACNLPSPCGGVTLNKGPFDHTAATCILEALRDRTISQYWTLHDFGAVAGQNADGETVFIVDALHAVSNWRSEQDLDFATGTKNRQILKPPAYFDGCLQLTDPTQIWSCMSDWSDGCADVEVSCPAP